MAWVFWDAEVIFINYLEKGKTITGEYYSNLLTRLDEKIHEKKPGLQKKKIIFHHPPTKVFWQWHYKLLEHPSYSPDLAPSDFNLFPKLNLLLAGQHFSSNQEVIAAVEGYFADLTSVEYYVQARSRCLISKSTGDPFFCGRVSKV